MEQGTLDQVRDLPHERVDHDMTYVPLPNRSELVFTGKGAQECLYDGNSVSTGT